MTDGSLNRRTLLRRGSALAAAGGLGLHRRLSIAAAASAGHPLAPLPGHFPAKAKHMIVFFMTGGLSHLDTFDYKPKLQRDHDKTVGKNKVLASPYRFRPRGESGKMVSELFEHVGGVVDEFCFLHTVHGDSAGHSAATLGMHTGSVTIPLPSLGSWISYGLGTLNTNLPSFVVLAAKEPYNGFQVWDANFLPGYHKGVRVVPGPDPLPDVRSPVPSVSRRDLEARMLRDLNQAHLSARDADQLLASRMTTFDTAYGLMREAPEAFDLGRESRPTLDLYGASADAPSSFAAQCLTARRLIERGVRVVELFDVGSNTNWDSHNNIDDHVSLARNVDQPIAALVADLKQRGLLDETLIVGCSEFGRTPWQDLTPRGRGHHSRCFTCFLAGGGVKGGFSFGVSDEYGDAPAEDPVHVHDFHATILHLMGLDHTRLTYRYSGRDFRLTDVHGNVMKQVIA
ncbi:MAG: DUF1501 domain-containing protein [Paludisphaera borealis]|uniref:DUF1501 domain-containing protein n=1 Tax=Paludisphaera borealis TaxID=1387353 RepID=UPI00284C5133|nr:DUF1501 domain-containing protein [Paludisphaera borealis]MDR3618958.1 DUF1501 domain-containing protein [Paludisphaera borealis]